MMDGPLQSEISKGAYSFGAGAMILSVGSVVAMVAKVIAEPILTRLFSPDAYGLAATVWGVGMMIGTIGCLGYERAIVLPKRDEDASSVLVLCACVIICISGVLAILVSSFGSALLIWFGAATLASVSWVIPVQAAIYASQLVLRDWNTRYRRFAMVATGTILAGLPMAVVEIIGGVLGFRTGRDLVLLRVFASGLVPLVLVPYVLSRDLSFLRRHVDVDAVIKAAKRYRDFPRFGSWSALLNVASYHAPILIVFYFYGAHVSGLFSKALFLMYLPIILIGESVGQVFMQESAAVHNAQDELETLTQTVFRRMLCLGFLPFAMMMIAGSEVFSVVLGARWWAGGLYAGILAPWMFTAFTLSSITTLFATLGRQRWLFISEIVLFASRTVALLLGGYLSSELHLSLILFSGSSVVVILWRCGYLLRITNVDRIESCGYCLRVASRAAPCLVLVATLKWLCRASDAIVFVSTLVAMAFYYVWVFYSDRDLRIDVCQLLRQIRWWPA